MHLKKKYVRIQAGLNCFRIMSNGGFCIRTFLGLHPSCSIFKTHVAYLSLNLSVKTAEHKIQFLVKKPF
jgi:hypothetical protein